MHHHLALVLLVAHRDLAQERHGEYPLHILPRAHLRVADRQQPQDTCRYRTSQHDGSQQDHHRLRSHRGIASRRRVDDTCVAFRHPLRQLVLLTLVQQVEIQFLFDLLAAFHRKDLLLLGRHSRDTAARLFLLRPDILDLDVQPDDQVIHRTDDGLLHRDQRIVQVLHHRVLATAVADQLVAFQQHLVELPDLRLDVHIRYARVRRDQVRTLAGVRQVVLDVFRQAQLVLQTQSLLAILAGGLQVHARLGRDIRQLVFPLVRLDIRIHIPQFFLDHDQTVVDEVGSVHHDLVLVVDRIRVVDGDQRVDHILRTRDGDILKRQVDDRRRLVRQSSLQASLEAERHILQRRFRHLHDRIEILVAVIKRRNHHHPADRRRDRVVQRHLHRLAVRHLLSAEGESGQYHLLSGDRNRLQRKSLCLFRIRERELYGRLGVQFHRPQPVFYRVAHIQMQVTRHFGHQPPGLEYQHLVIHIPLRTEKPQILESGRLAHRTALRIIFDQYRSRPGIYLGRPLQIEERRPGTYHDRQNKPIPISQHRLQDVPQVQFVLFHADVRFLFCVHRFSFFTLLMSQSETRWKPKRKSRQTRHPTICSG